MNTDSQLVEVGWFLFLSSANICHMRLFWPYLFIGVALAILTGCSGNVPKILAEKSGVLYLYTPENRRVEQYLTMEIAVEDQDGIDDIEAIYLINDERELFWNLTEDIWQQQERDNITWIGSSWFRLPSGDILKSANYRIVLIDSAGRRDERETYIRTVSGIPGPETFPFDLEFGAFSNLKQENVTLLQFPLSPDQGPRQDSEFKTVLSSAEIARNRIDSNLPFYIFASKDGIDYMAGPYKLE